MKTELDLTIDIVGELARIQNSPEPYGTENELPRLIGVGGGRVLRVSRAMDVLIQGVARIRMQKDGALKSKYTQAEWQAAVRRAFGPALVEIDLSDEATKNANLVLAALDKNLASHISGDGKREFVFGCTLFSEPVVRDFSIGPVRFEPRIDWLARKEITGAISPISSRRIRSAWAGKTVRKRKPSRDSRDETFILQLLEKSPYVVSVATDQLGADAGREKALRAARIATATIALLWTTPSNVLKGINLSFDRRPHIQNFLFFVGNKQMSSGSSWSHLPHGPWLKEGEWDAELTRHDLMFSAVGDILHSLVNPEAVVPNPKMQNTLAQALQWFHEGCRETDTLMAIIKFSTVLDTLACGGKSKGIRKLINSRLGLRIVNPSGRTVRRLKA